MYWIRSIEKKNTVINVVENLINSEIKLKMKCVTNQKK